MKICVVSGESRAALGGLSAYNRNLSRGLLAAGAEVACVSRFDRDLVGILDYASGTNRIGRTIDGVATRLVGPAPWTRPLLPRLRHVTSRGSLRRLGPLLFSTAYRRGLAAAVPRGVDVIHYIGTGWELLGFTCLTEARRRRIGFTLLPAVHPGTWGDSPLDVDLYKRSDATFVLSELESDHLLKLGVPREKLVITPLAPAAPPAGDGLRFRRTRGLGDRPIVLFIARKLRSKGFHVLCEAMEQVLAHVPDVCLVALGPDGEKPYPSVAGHAYLDVGPADDATKADALAACDIFCMPSAAESFGIVYVEAWSYGKPVIGGPAPAVQELIRQGEAGYTVDQDPKALALALTKLLLDPSLRSRLGQAGRRLQQGRFNWPIVVRKHLEIFERAAKSETSIRSLKC